MPNTYKNKVVYNGTTLIDLTADTVTADTLMQGYTAHAADGSTIVGTVPNGDNLGYGVSTQPLVGTAIVGSASLSE